MINEYKVEIGNTDDKYTWVYCEDGENREYIAGSAGRIKISDARMLADALNEYSLCAGECR